MIAEAESIRDFFSIFHDGDIEKAVLSEGTLKMTIDIPYLANWVNSGYKFFYVELDDFRDAEFHAWPATLKGEKVLVNDLATIFKSPLEILESNLKEGRFEIICNIKSTSNSDYCGGELLFKTDSARVRDEANKEYSISELTEICSGYWNEWKSKNAKHI